MFKCKRNSLIIKDSLKYITDFKRKWKLDANVVIYEFFFLQNLIAGEIFLDISECIAKSVKCLEMSVIRFCRSKLFRKHIIFVTFFINLCLCNFSWTMFIFIEETQMEYPYTVEVVFPYYSKLISVERLIFKCIAMQIAFYV